MGGARDNQPDKTFQVGTPLELYRAVGANSLSSRAIGLDIGLHMIPSNSLGSVMTLNSAPSK